MAITKVPMTVRGEQLLRAELTELKSVTRPRIIQAIATAREHGDLKRMPNIMRPESSKVSVKAEFKRLKLNFPWCK